MEILCPLVSDNGRIVYPEAAPMEQWIGSFVYNNSLVGEFTGELYLEDGVTKAFEWEKFDVSGIVDYGTVITNTAFRLRLGSSLLASVELLSFDQPDASPEVRLSKAKLRQDLQTLATYKKIDLTDMTVTSMVKSFIEELVEEGSVADSFMEVQRIYGKAVTLDELTEEDALKFSK